MNSASPNPSRGCYEYPQYWDLSFRSETKLEADFIDAACRKYVSTKCRRLFEPGFGGGRLVVEMAARGYELVGLDTSDACVKYVQKRLTRRSLKADVQLGDMTDFDLAKPCDAAFCTFNTFRHLTSETTARSHLNAVARNLNVGGIYILGFHIIPLDAEETAIERWTARHGRTSVTTTLRVTSFDRRKRLETLRFSLRVRNGKHDQRIVSEFPYRLYTADQFKRLLKSVPEFRLLDVYDFWYDIDYSVEFDDEISDAVFILQKT
jgi:SAM-dependent methyltransferase